MPQFASFTLINEVIDFPCSGKSKLGLCRYIRQIFIRCNTLILPYLICFIDQVDIIYLPSCTNESLCSWRAGFYSFVNKDSVESAHGRKLIFSQFIKTLSQNRYPYVQLRY
uniref:Uncharacterized protein n=1 Tax=Sipha flava TaxID=143950 RepID=A0A2S2R6Q4_9HEMI